ncbi:MAG: DsbA family protein [Alphaproteobacteria bacterium]
MIDGKDLAKAKAFAQAAYRASCGEGRDIASPEAVADIAAGLGVDRAQLLAALQDPAVKDLARKATDDAVARGVFGSPYFIADGEAFWGVDRMDQLERWIASGPY